MSYQARILPPEEWAEKLSGTDAGRYAQALAPADTRVLVVEDAAGTLVGTWVVTREVHVECVWIHPDHRAAPGIVKRLLAGMYRIARDWHARAVWTGSISDEVRTLVQKLGGAPVPGQMCVLPVLGEKSCHS